MKPYMLRQFVFITRLFLIGPHPLITIGSTTISWVHHTRLLGIIIDHKLTWSKHLSDLKRNFSKKLNLLKKYSFLKRRALLDLYFKVILPSVTYGIIVWGGCNNSNHIQALETLHRRAARIIFNLQWDTPSDTVMEITKWDSILDLYKLSLIKGQMNQNFDILSLPILKQPNARRIHY